VGTADVVSYLWRKLTDVVLGYPEVYICVCYIPQKKDFSKLRNSYLLSSAIMNALQNDALEYQSKGAQTLVCGHLNAGTAEKPAILKAEQQPCLPIGSSYCIR